MSDAHIVFYHGLAIVYILGWFFVWSLHLIALLFGKRYLHRAIELPSPEDLNGVSIIKPLLGTDPNLKNNLDSFFHLDYPLYEILFSVEDKSDPALPIIQELMETYPQKDARLFIGNSEKSTNGKINNMLQPYRASKFDLILISDSGVLMKPNTLMRMVACMKDNAGIVIQMPYSCDREGFASIYEKVYFGTMQARMYLCANALQLTCCTGMSCLTKKSVLEEVGGLVVFAKYLAEDFFLANAVSKKGYKVIISPDPGLQNSGTYSIKCFHARLVRWCYLRTVMLPYLYFFEPMSECLILGVCSSFAIQYEFGMAAWKVFIFHAFTWCLLDYCLLRTVENGPLKFSLPWYFAAWAMREVLTVYIFMRSFTTRRIVWRNKVYRIHWGGQAEELKSFIV